MNTLAVGVRFLDLDTQFVDVSPQTRVEDIKKEVCNEMMAKISYFIVTLSGNELQDRLLLCDEGIDENTVLEIELSRQGIGIQLIGRETTQQELIKLVSEEDNCEELNSIQSFIDAGNLNVNQLSAGFAPIHYAVQRNHLHAINVLSTVRDFDINKQGDDYITPLCVACRSGNIDTVKAILSIKGVSVSTSNSYDWSPLHIACEMGYTAVVKLLLEMTDVDVNDKVPLLVAVGNNAMDIVTTLLSHGSINADKAYGGHTPLFDACKKGYIDIVKQLLGHRTTSVNRKLFSRSLLACASSRGHLDIVEHLLSFPELRIDEAGIRFIDPALMAEQKGFKVIARIIEESRQYKEALARV